MENVKVSITDTQPCEISLAVQIHVSEVAKEKDAVFNEIMRAAKMPGFRRGKAPMDYVKQTY